MSETISSANPTWIDTVTRANMTQNGWQNRIVKVNSSGENYQVYTFLTY